MGYGDKMKIKKSQLRKIIKEELIKEDSRFKGKWIVHSKGKIIKVVNKHHEAVILLNKLIKTLKYDELAMTNLKTWNKKHSPKIKEASYIDPDEAGVTINNALDDLKQSLKRVRNPEKWAEKYHRGLPGVIDMIERLTLIFGKMK